jgi:phage terminase large subunit-like protein
VEVIERCRWPASQLPMLSRTVVAVDPSGARGPEDVRSDAIGIVVGAMGQDGRAYVLGDRTLRAGPERWAREVLAASDLYGADCIVAERNYGGDMVRAVIQGIRPTANVKLVTASKGKHVRAEPVAALYDETQDRVRHAGRFTDLEDEMGGFTTSGYAGDRSPNRVDALVWLLTELLLEQPAVFFVA